MTENKNDFYENPSLYVSDFLRFAIRSDVYIAGHFYGKDAPCILTPRDYKHSDFSIQYIGDVSCDIKVPIASTLRASSIQEPFYGYDPIAQKECDYYTPNTVTVMAVDNLPCELPRAASIGFSKQFIQWVLPAFFNQDQDGVLDRSKICEDKALCEKFTYLTKYAQGLE